MLTHYNTEHNETAANLNEMSAATADGSGPVLHSGQAGGQYHHITRTENTNLPRLTAMQQGYDLTPDIDNSDMPRLYLRLCVVRAAQRRGGSVGRERCRGEKMRIGVE